LVLSSNQIIYRQWPWFLVNFTAVDRKKEEEEKTRGEEQLLFASGS
jgi:hypothetical protein